ncbi:hypothetical protein Tco_0439720 [Tanacetum coccineum]
MKKQMLGYGCKENCIDPVTLCSATSLLATQKGLPKELCLAVSYRRLYELLSTFSLRVDNIENRWQLDHTAHGRKLIANGSAVLLFVSHFFSILSYLGGLLTLNSGYPWADALRVWRDHGILIIHMPKLLLFSIRSISVHASLTISFNFLSNVTKVFASNCVLKQIHDTYVLELVRLVDVGVSVCLLLPPHTINLS